jgi:hypothetical protein
MLPIKRRLLSCMIIAPILLGGCFTVTHLLSTGLIRRQSRSIPMRPMFTSRWPPPDGMMYAPRLVATKAQRQFAYSVALEQLDSFKTGNYDALAMAQGRFAPLFFMDDDLTYYDYLKHTARVIRAWKSVDIVDAHTVIGDSGIWLTLAIKEPGKNRHGEVMFYAKPLDAQPQQQHGPTPMPAEF